MKTKLLLFATLLMSGICMAQSNPTTFTNTNQPKPEPQSLNFHFNIATENGHPVGTCPAPCKIHFSNSSFIAITLPDIPNQIQNQDTLICTIKSTAHTGTYGCQTSKCQSVTYTATAEHDGDNNDFSCRDADMRVWKLVTTQYFHWRKSGTLYYQHYDGGKGTLSHK